MLKYKLGFAALLALTIACAALVVVLARSGPPGAAPDSDGRNVIEPSVEPDRGEQDGLPDGAERARVVDHVDGDTLRLTPSGDSSYLADGEETTVRLLEIDTPESVDPGSPTECYSSKAHEELKNLAPLGGEVWIKADQELLDPYGRTLLYLWTSEGVFINLEMVRSGAARAVLFEPNDRYIGVMRRAEKAAKRAAQGLWGACNFFGEPRGFARNPTPTPGPKGVRKDPRFPYCSDANSAGYGNYVSGRDPEYDWYEDADSDGIVCEF